MCKHCGRQFSNPTDRGATRTMWDNCASRCTWMAWDCAALNESRTFITPPWYWIRSCWAWTHGCARVGWNSRNWPGWTANVCGQKRQKIWLAWRITGVRASWLGWETGVRKRSSACGGLSCWQSFWYAMLSYGLSSVEDDLPLSKTYMTRIEGENTRASLFGTIAPQDVCASRVDWDVECSLVCCTIWKMAPYIFPPNHYLQQRPKLNQETSTKAVSSKAKLWQRLHAKRLLRLYPNSISSTIFFCLPWTGNQIDVCFRHQRQ